MDPYFIYTNLNSRRIKHLGVKGQNKLLEENAKYLCYLEMRKEFLQQKN